MSGTIDYKDGMKIFWDVAIEMDDGLNLRADIFCPIEDGKYPVLMTHGPYGKWLAFQDAYAPQWGSMTTNFPEILADSSSKYQNWEVVDPERWVPDDYVCIRIDSRGAGRSPGYLDPFSKRETKDFYDCIEWAAVQEWSNGKVGLNGISYYAINQWQVAAMQPPHLSAVCIWEGASDLYREMSHHGGIFCTYGGNWYKGRCLPRQHGMGVKGYRARVNGQWVSGPDTMSEEELGYHRADMANDLFSNNFSTDLYWTDRMPDFSKINVPLFSSSNWGGQSLHSRGNFEGFNNAASKEKWLEVHGIEHWTEFYTDYGVNLQKKFFGHYLKGEDTGWKKQPKVLLQVRHPEDKFVEREESEWPLARTKWTKFFLNPKKFSLETEANNHEDVVNYKGLGDGVTFVTPPLESEMEITGPLSSRLYISSETEDADVFLILRVFTEDFKEVVFQGALDPTTPTAHGWLRASRRKLDIDLSLPYRPFHTHDEDQLLEPGEIYEIDVEIWPTSVVIPKNYRIGLTVRGKDYVYQTGGGSTLPNMNKFSGCGPFLHDDSRDRPFETFSKNVSLHFSESHNPYVLLPIIE